MSSQKEQDKKKKREQSIMEKEMFAFIQGCL